MIPENAKYYNFDRAWFQEPEEQLEPWRRSVKLQNAKRPDEPVLGVPLDGLRFYQALARWAGTPTSPWLYVQGSVGTGKSVLMAAFVRRLRTSRGPDFERVPLPVERMSAPPELTRKANRAFRLRRGSGRLGVAFVSERELHRACRSAQDGDRKVLGWIYGSQVTVLDDLGSAQRPHGSLAARDYLAENVEALVCSRYAAGLPTIFTSNLQLRALAELYGERTVSRIRDRAASHVWTMNTQWRNP